MREKKQNRRMTKFRKKEEEARNGFFRIVPD